MRCQNAFLGAKGSGGLFLVASCLVYGPTAARGGDVGGDPRGLFIAQKQQHQVARRQYDIVIVKPLPHQEAETCDDEGMNCIEPWLVEVRDPVGRPGVFIGFIRFTVETPGGYVIYQEPPDGAPPMPLAAGGVGEIGWRKSFSGTVTGPEGPKQGFDYRFIVRIYERQNDGRPSQEAVREFEVLDRNGRNIEKDKPWEVVRNPKSGDRLADLLARLGEVVSPETPGWFDSQRAWLEISLLGRPPEKRDIRGPGPGFYLGEGMILDGGTYGTRHEDSVAGIRHHGRTQERLLEETVHLPFGPPPVKSDGVPSSHGMERRPREGRDLLPGSFDRIVLPRGKW